MRRRASSPELPPARRSCSRAGRARDGRPRGIRHAADDNRNCRDLIPDRFKHVIDEGGVLHVRVQTELWEKPAGVGPSRLSGHRSHVSGWRARRPAASRVDRRRDGLSVPVAARAGAEVPLVVDIGRSRARDRGHRYYVHVIATVETLADREVDEAGDAVFRAPDGGQTAGIPRPLVFRTAMQVSGYLQSVSAETKSRRLLGRDIIH